MSAEQPTTAPTAPAWVRWTGRLGWVLTALLVPIGGCIAVALADQVPAEHLGEGLFLAVLSCAFLCGPGFAFVGRDLAEWAAAQRMTRVVPGVVTADATVQVPGESDWLTVPGVAYSYEVDGQRCTGEHSASSASNIEALTRAAKARLPRVGSTVQVRYDPADPQQSVLVGHEPGLGVGAVIGGFLIAVGFGCVALFLRIATSVELQ